MSDKAYAWVPGFDGKPAITLIDAPDTTAPKTLRDEFAMAAIKSVGILHPIQSVEDVSRQAYEIADAMMKARQET